MTLEESYRAHTENPSASDIGNAIDRLCDGKSEFIILTSEGSRFMQTAPAGNNLFVLEYSEGPTERHFTSSRQISREELQRAMVQYCSGNSNWLSDFQWEPLEKEEESNPVTLPARALYIAAIVIGIIFILSLLVKAS